MKQLVLACAILAILFTSCEKEPGEGGTSSISGKVYVLDYNSTLTHLNETYYGSKEDVYIVYGDNTVYNNSMETSFDGSYRFDNLRKGHYRIFAYSKDSTATIPGGVFAVIKEVDITSNKQDINLDDLIIVK
ncbi:MAG: hypothetical protein IPH88_16070 [Bacteroidales bacterium]|nr:hypothetical protein [Bacteroidales bacterium]